MSDKTIIAQIRLLPDNLKEEVMRFVENLKKNYTQKLPSSKSGKRQFGSAKGKYVLSKDFDEPLEDFKDYE
jgi:hypothetical protein